MQSDHHPDDKADDQATADEPAVVDDADPQSVACDGGKPQPPQTLPKYLTDGVERQSPEELRDLAAYAKQMAEWMEYETQREFEERADQSTTETPDEWDDDGWEDAVDDAREAADISALKGTLTIKTIDGRDYYYLQWRDGSKIKSQYVAPVTPANDE
jgi:hypothetical protein